MTFVLQWCVDAPGTTAFVDYRRKISCYYYYDLCQHTPTYIHIHTHPQIRYRIIPLLLYKPGDKKRTLCLRVNCWMFKNGVHMKKKCLSPTDAVYRGQGNLNGESAVAAILPSWMNYSVWIFSRPNKQFCLAMCCLSRMEFHQSSIYSPFHNSSTKPAWRAYTQKQMFRALTGRWVFLSMYLPAP